MYNFSISEIHDVTKSEKEISYQAEVTLDDQSTFWSNREIVEKEECLIDLVKQLVGQLEFYKGDIYHKEREIEDLQKKLEDEQKHAKKAD